MAELRPYVELWEASRKSETQALAAANLACRVGHGWVVALEQVVWPDLES